MPTNIRYSRLVPAALGSFALTFASGAARAESTDLDWVATGYLWGADIGVDSRDRSVDASFSDVIDKLEIAFMGHVEAQGDTVGGFVDVVFMAVGDNVSRDLAELNADLDLTLMDVALVWSPGAERYTGVEVYGGFRYLATDFDLRVDPIPPSPPEFRTGIDKSYSDFLLGVRYGAPINEQWRLVFSGDLSGGDTEGTWTLAGYGVYRSGPHRFFAGYKHLDAEVEARNAESVTMTFSGPVLGYGFSF